MSKKILFFGLHYNLLKQQLEFFFESINENLAYRLIYLLKSLIELLLLFISKPDDTLQLYIDYCKSNVIILKN